MNKFKYVFLLGRPGCGKSAVYRELEKKLINEGIATSFERVDDFPKLWNKFQQDDKKEKNGEPRKYSKPTEDGGYKVTNNDVWNDILKDLNDDILTIDKGDKHLVFIEFSRNNYIEALSNFSDKIISNAIAIYIDVAFEICWERNVARHEQAIAEGGDDHLVSREEMEKTYLYDDRDIFTDYDKCPVVVINNEKTGVEHLTQQVEKVVDVLKQN